MIYPYGLFAGKKVTMILKVDKAIYEEAQLEFLGYVGKDGWLHFRNVRDETNHLVKEDQYPLHVYKMGEVTCQLKYT